MTSRGFTLIEMLLATVLASILMGAVLVAAAALSRDRMRIESRQSTAKSPAALEIIRSDLANGVAFVGAPNAHGFTLVGFAGINPKTMSVNQRLVRITYRLTGQGRSAVLVRDQAYLDDPVRVDRWSDIVAIGVTRISIVPLANDGEQVRLGDDVSERILAIDRIRTVPTANRVPSRVRVRIESITSVQDQDMVLR